MDQYKVEVEYKENRTEARFYINDKIVFGFRYYPTSDIGDYKRVDILVQSGSFKYEKNNNLVTLIPANFKEFQRLVILSVLLGTIERMYKKPAAIVAVYNLDPSTLNCWYNFLLRRYEIPKSTEREKWLTLTAYALRVYLGLSR
jgi:hypothetical protein